MAIKNNVTRMLESQKVSFAVFEIPPEKHSALEVCDHLSIAPEIVFKTIVFRREKGGKPILAVVPASGNVNPKALACALGEKKVKVTTRSEAEKITGLLAGGISPLALINKGFDVVLDSSALEQPHILVSGGKRGMQIQIAAIDLVRITQARTASITSQN
jgi:Cys-tRNA(Pro)/Cys-tRNA(Cys) deacylase